MKLSNTVGPRGLSEDAALAPCARMVIGYLIVVTEPGRDIGVWDSWSRHRHGTMLWHRPMIMARGHGIGRRGRLGCTAD